jgi:hypothetical protein
MPESLRPRARHSKVPWSTLTALVLADGPPSAEQACILELVAKEVAVGPGEAAIADAHRRTTDAAELLFRDAAVALAKIDGEDSPAWPRLRAALPSRVHHEERAVSRARAARARIEAATAVFLHTVGSMADEPLAAYVTAVARLESERRDALREAIGLA